MIEEIAIIGAGGFGREISLLIDTVNQRRLQYRIIGFFDDGIPKGTKVNGSEVLGRVEDLNFITKDLNVVIAIGNDNILVACSLLTRKIKDGKKYFGIPARILSE